MQLGWKAALGTITVMTLVVVGTSLTYATTDSPRAKDIRCRHKIMKSVISLASRQMRIRSDCFRRQAAGVVNANVNCLGNPVRGITTGSPQIDEALVKTAQRATALGDRIGGRCDAPFRSPASIDVDQLCVPATTDPHGWRAVLECGYDLLTNSADRLSELTYRRVDAGAQPLDDTERFCREMLTDSVRATFLGRIRQRSGCFRKAEKRSFAFNCLATVAWPGRVDLTGYRSADRTLMGLLVKLRGTLRDDCGAGVSSMRFTDDPRIVDYTLTSPSGATFTDEDLFHNLEDDVLEEEATVLAKRMFPGLSYCGDGVIDSFRGEVCDDGNLESCDGCERDCTLPACRNGAACGPSEICDDGNTVLSDGCNTTCGVERCGDGIVHVGLGETCDDGNTIDCDGCDSNCTPSGLCNNGITCASYGEQCDDGLGVCLIGADSRDHCLSDVDCRGSCVGGAADRRTCTTNVDCSLDASSVCAPATRCGGICSGGARDRELCAGDTDCPGKCLALSGQGQACVTEANCPLGMVCNGSLTCVLSREGGRCTDNSDCGTAGYCELSRGCMAGNSDTLGDRCRDNCKLPACGDGVVDSETNTNGFGGEKCDDGNLVDGDGCDSNCTPTACGNGIVTAGEQCDLGPGACAGGFNDHASCFLDSECHGYCFDHPETPCDASTAVMDCNNQVCITSSGCIGGNTDAILCTLSCTVPLP